jgi:predicted metal-dependent hydrolase
VANITVRKIRFSFDGPIDFDVSDEALASMLSPLALSMTMPYLEPYLIRTMREAIPRIGDPVLAEDAKRFSQQEGHHYRNHALFNKQIRAQFDGPVAAKLQGIE